ncbi:SidA/IucD/PvdA family monooxygenase [Streptomyces sp. NRRL B-1347]|uniref:SidA/IucD/PvdA family monooxygenase n=1 Tax=Streptomyces sp. NRRL B-1347 TaxID=1476877 RepID=UPI00131D6811|nr:SidA/IucD/PvdA family monooxygenase [Streptomyces sp. NRRL B-1347]
MLNDALESPLASGPSPTETYDVVGIGFGPSNLALAIAAREIDPLRGCLFLERGPCFRWHPGMLLEGSRMQISFLKDLVSLRNLASPYSFLNYLKHRGRLERFVNLHEFHPSRAEYSDYLAWAADDFSEQVRYGADVVGVTPHGTSSFDVRYRERSSGRTRTVRARNVVVAPGGRPRIPEGADLDHVIHSSEFLPRFAERLPDTERAHRIVLVGDGQSAGEIAMQALREYPAIEVHLIASGIAPRPTDNSSFVNEQYFSDSSRRFLEQPADRRARQLADVRNSNYGAVEERLLDDLYRLTYLDEVKGRRRLFIHPYSRLVAAGPGEGGTLATVQDRLDGTTTTLPCDLVVLATGYERRLDRRTFADVLPYVRHDPEGEPVLTAAHRVALTPPLTAGLYVQGLGESSFGLGDTLLSLLPFRSRQIVDDIAARLGPASVDRAAPYPPDRHVERDAERMYAVVERFKFATVISARGTDDPVVTQLPLTLDRSRGGRGVLFGHLDRENPQARLLDDRPVTLLFNGPNSYISPTVYETDQLPTWNSITVQVRGRARIVRDRERIVAGMCELAARSERNPGPPTLEPDNERIDKLIDFVVGFEVEITDIVGRFKLSQDQEERERLRAAHALADTAGTDHRDLIGQLLGMPLDNGRTAPNPGGGIVESLVGGDGSGHHV